MPLRVRACIMLSRRGLPYCVRAVLLHERGSQPWRLGGNAFQDFWTQKNEHRHDGGAGGMGDIKVVLKRGYSGISASICCNGFLSQAGLSIPACRTSRASCQYFERPLSVFNLSAF